MKISEMAEEEIEYAYDQMIADLEREADERAARAEEEREEAYASDHF